MYIPKGAKESALSYANISEVAISVQDITNSLFSTNAIDVKLNRHDIFKKNQYFIKLRINIRSIEFFVKFIQ